MQSREFPGEVTFACNDGKQLWTRAESQVSWFASSVDAEIAMLEAQKKCAHQAWVSKSEWLIQCEADVRSRLETLRLAATP